MSCESIDFTLKFNKWEFLLTGVRFLRHIVSALGVLVDPKKVEAVMS